jgi:hypothetical protein
MNTENNTSKSRAIYINFADNESLQFIPTSNYRDITAKQVVKIMTSKKLTIRTSSMTEKGHVNFNLGNGSAMFGHINFFDNDLVDESSDDDKNTVIAELRTLLKSAVVAMVSMKLTADEVNASIDAM